MFHYKNMLGIIYEQKCHVMEIYTNQYIDD